MNPMPRTPIPLLAAATVFAASSLADSVNNVLNFELKTISVTQNGANLDVPVTVISGQSYYGINGSNETRDATYVFGPGGPDGLDDADVPSQYRIIAADIENSDKTFNSPSLVSGFAYCKLHPADQIITEQLAELARVEVASVLIQDADHADLRERISRQAIQELDAKRTKLLKDIEESKVTQITLDPIQAMADSADPTALAMWWPVMITHFVKGGVPGTEVVFQAQQVESVNPNGPGAPLQTTILRVYLAEGTKARLSWTDGFGQTVNRELQLHQFMTFTIQGAQVAEGTAPSDVTTDANLEDFFELTGDIFTDATAP